MPPQVVSTITCELESPYYNTDRGDGYGYQVKGYLVGTTLESIGRYTLKVRKNTPEELIATWVITFNDGRTIIWEGNTHYEIYENQVLNFSYEATILRSSQKVIADFTPSGEVPYEGRLRLFFLE